jgi:hypothetical protein
VAVLRAHRLPDRSLAAGVLAHRAVGSQRAHGALLRRERGDGRAGTAAAPASRRVAGIQPAAVGADRPAGSGLAGPRVRRQVGGGRDRQPQHLQLPVPHRGLAAALAPTQLPRRGGARSAEHRRRADTVSAVRRHRRPAHPRAGRGRHDWRTGCRSCSCTWPAPTASRR